MTYPAEITYSELVRRLAAAGFRPDPAKPLPGHAAWKAPEQVTAWCPCCRTDSLVVEPWSSTDPRAVVFCVNERGCSAHQGARTEQDVHEALLPHVEAALAAFENRED